MYCVDVDDLSFAISFFMHKTAIAKGKIPTALSRFYYNTDIDILFREIKYIAQASNHNIFYTQKDIGDIDKKKESLVKKWYRVIYQEYGLKYSEYLGNFVLNNWEILFCVQQTCSIHRHAKVNSVY